MAKALDVDVVYSGYLLYKMKGKLSSAYHQVICSLHRESLQGAKRLELKDMTSGKITVVPLRSLLEVREVVMKKEKDSLHSFEVVCAKVKYLLVAENCEERDTWLGHINKVLSGEPEPGVTYEFRVSLQANESSKKHGLSGNYVLKVSDCNIALYSATSLISTQFALKLTGIKRLQQCSLVDKHRNKEEILVIYTMPQSEVGDGTFVFKASDAGEISQVIDWRIKNAFQSTGSPFEGGADHSPPPPQVPDRRGRHNRQVESHIYHEEPRIDLIERNGSVSSTRSIGSLKHQSSDVSIGSEGSFHGNNHRKTLSSLKRGNSEDLPPTPPPRSVLKRPLVSDSDNVDEEILVETHEIQAQIEALKKGGLLPQRSFSQMDEHPLSPRRRPLRGTMSGGSPPFDASGRRISEARSESHSPPLSSPGASRNHSSLASNSSMHSDGSPIRKRFSKQSSSSSLAQTFTSDFPIDVIVRHDREMGHRQSSSESLPLSKWQPHKAKEARIPPHVPERDRDESDSYYLRDIDINPGPVRPPRPNPVGNSGSEMGSGSMTNSSIDENGYLILTQDDKEAIARFKSAKEGEHSTSTIQYEMEMQEQLYSEVDDFRERPQYPSSPFSDDNYEPVPGEIGGAELMHRRRRLGGRKVEEVYDVDDEVLGSRSYLEKDGVSSPLSPYYNMRDGGNMRPVEHRDSSSEDFDDANIWKDSYTSDTEDVEYYNGPFVAPHSTVGVTGRWNSGECAENTVSEVAGSDYMHADDTDEREYYNSAEQVVPSGRPQKQHSEHKSSSVTRVSDVTPAVSATPYSGGSDTDEDEREDPRDVAQLTRSWRSRQEHVVFNSVEKLQSVKFSQNQVSVNNSAKTDQ